MRERRKDTDRDQKIQKLRKGHRERDRNMISEMQMETVKET